MRPARSSIEQASTADPVFDLTPQHPAGFLEGTRTGDWLAVGDASAQIKPSTIPPPAYPAPSPRRRIFVRVVGGMAISATLFLLIRIATNVSARQAMLRWGSFGQHQRIAASVRR